MRCTVLRLIKKRKIEMRTRLDVWDDDESDELFYIDRVRRLEAEEAADAKSRSRRRRT